MPTVAKNHFLVSLVDSDTPAPPLHVAISSFPKEAIFTSKDELSFLLVSQHAATIMVVIVVAIATAAAVTGQAAARDFICQKKSSYQTLSGPFLPYY